MQKQAVVTFPLRSKRSFIATYVLSLTLLVLGGAIAFAGLSGSADTIAWRILSGLVGATTVFVALKTFTFRVEVARDGMEVHQWWREHWIAWEHVTEIEVVPTYADSEHMNVRYGKKRLTLPIGFMKDPRVLNMAIVEAATSANKEIELSALTVKLYGRPPYGIFSDPRAVS